MYEQALKMAVLSRNVFPADEGVPTGMVHVLQSHASLLERLGRWRELERILEKFDREVVFEEGGLVWIWRRRMKARTAANLNPEDNYTEAFSVFTSSDLANAGKYDESLKNDDLAGILMFRGQYREAEVAARQALVERSGSLGPGHASTLTASHHLAEILFLGGKPAEALRYATSTTAGREKVLVLGHPDTLLSRALKGRILLSLAVTLSDLDEAKTLIEDCRERLSSILGATNPAVLAERQDLATLQLRRGEYENANHGFRSLLKVKEEFWGSDLADHPEILSSKHALAEVIFLRDGPKAVEEMMKDVVEARVKILGASHPDTLTTLFLQARIFSAVGSHDGARELIEKVVNGRTSTLGISHPATSLAMSYRAEIFRSSFGTSCISTSQTPSQPVVYLANEIDTLSSRACTALSLVYGSEHHLSLQAATHLALALSSGEIPEIGSVHAFRHIYTTFYRCLGNSNPESLKAQWRLAEALARVVVRSTGALDLAAVEEAKSNWREALVGMGSQGWVAERAWRSWEDFMGALEKKGVIETGVVFKEGSKVGEEMEWRGEMEWEGEGEGEKELVQEGVNKPSQ